MTIRRSVILIAVPVLASLVASLNWAQQANEVAVDFHGFQDTRGVTVLSPTVDLAQDYTERTSLRLNYGLDAISAASDSCVGRSCLHQNKRCACRGPRGAWGLCVIATALASRRSH